jgi:zinc protease
LFSKSELDKTKKQSAAEIQAAMADTAQVASNAFYGTLYKPGCVYYQRPFKQQLSDLGKTSSEQLKAFHHAHFNPANTVIAVVGDMQPESAFQLVEKNFNNWQGAPAAKIDVSNCSAASTGKRITNPISDKTNVEVVMGCTAATDICAPDWYAASIANAALGHDTISSRLAELRNKHGLTYGISSYFSENSQLNGAWLIDFTVNPENLNKSLPIVRGILADYQKTGITKEELSNEVNRLAGEYIVERMRTPHQLADAITKYEILGMGPDFMDVFPERLKAVTVPEANAAIHKYFDPAKLVTSVAGSIAAQASKSK